MAQIPDTGLHRDIEADPAARAAMAELAGLREILSAQCFVRSDARERRPRPCRGPCPGAGRADLRGDARSDRERHRRADRSDLRAARADSRNSPIWSTRPPTATSKFRIRRSRSKTASSISAGSRPMRCFSAIDPYPRKPDAVFEPPVVAGRSRGSSLCRAEGAASSIAKPPVRRSPESAEAASSAAELACQVLDRNGQNSA